MVEDCHRERERWRVGAFQDAKIDIYQNEMCCASYIWWSGAMVEDTCTRSVCVVILKWWSGAMVEDTRSGCVEILKYGGVVQWQKTAIAKERDSALEHSRKLRQTSTRKRCVVLPKHGGVVQSWEVLEVVVL